MSRRQQIVLVVDDVPANIDILSGMLRDDYKVKAATSGERGLRIAGSDEPPDLILLDVMMPEMDGFEVCRRLRADTGTREIPIMFVTALDEVDCKVKGFEVGGTDYITKPFEPLEVKARVKSLLDAKAYQDAVKKQMAAELEIAREIQQGLLPDDPGALVADLPFELQAYLEPARQVGGDLYLVLPRPDGTLCLVLGDVSGKGIPAALFMAVVSTLVRSLINQTTDPAELLTRLNRELAAQNPRTMFVTIVSVVIDPVARTLDFASGGHNDAFLLRAGRAPVPMSSTGPLVGVFPDLPITGRTVDFDPGDTFVVFTDGVDEALDESEEMFGAERILETLAGLGGQPASAVVDGLVSAVASFVGDAPPSDDLAVLAVRLDPEE